MRRVRMMFTRDSSFRKVRFILVVGSFLPQFSVNRLASKDP
jgi:hypothetical protein